MLSLKVIWQLIVFFFLFFFSQALVLQQYCASNSEVTVFHGMFKAFED